MKKLKGSCLINFAEVSAYASLKVATKGYFRGKNLDF